MAKPEWGAKVVCKDCGMRFYSLKRKEPECPTCDTVHKFKKVTKPKMVRKPEPKPEAKPAEADTKSDETDEDIDAETDDALLLNEDDDDDDLNDSGENGNGIMEDTSDLSKDDDDMSEVMEHVEKPEDNTA